MDLKRVTLCLILLVAISGQNSFSQSLREKLKAKTDELTGGEKTEPNAVDTLGYRSLDEIAALWGDGNYAIRMIDEQVSIGFKQEIKFLKGDDGKIASIVIGDDEYKPKKVNGSSFVYEYKREYGRKIYMTGNTIIKYDGSNYDPKIYDIYGAKMSRAKAIKEIIAFDSYNGSIIKQDQSDTKDKEEKERKEREAANLAKYGLADKEVVKIEVINLEGGKKGKIGCYSKMTYDLQATLKDGTIIRTDQGGYTSDFKVVEKHVQTDSWGKIEAKHFDKDVFGLEVTLKSNPKIKTYKEIDLNYNQAISFNWSAYGSSSSNGSSARTIIIKLKQVKHSETGANLLKVSISGVDGSVLAEFKISPDANILITMQGGYGEGGYNGGNGGNITLIKDPNVEYYGLIADLGGGNGFNNGRDGQIKETTRTVNF